MGRSNDRDVRAPSLLRFPLSPSAAKVYKVLQTGKRRVTHQRLSVNRHSSPSRSPERVCSCSLRFCPSPPPTAERCGPSAPSEPDFLTFNVNRDGNLSASPSRTDTMHSPA
jgi:hypothetical protein